MDTAPVPPTFVPPPPRRRGGCLTGFLGGCLTAVVLVFALFVALPVWLLSSGAEQVSFHVGPAQPYAVEAGDPAAKDARGVLRLALNGVITGAAPRWGGEDCDAAVLEAIERAIDDDTIDAILLAIDSPGGGVGASDALYHALERFKAADPGRKVVVQAGDLLASGAYYVAMQADWIAVRPTTVVGSIGVIMPGFNASALAQRLGVADASIASGPSKDLGNPLKPVNAAHVSILQTVVDDLYDRFVGIVADGRGLPESDVRALADGRILSAEDALAHRLVDAIGYEDGLDAKLAELLGCPEDRLVRYVPPRRPALGGLLDGLGASLGRGAAEALLTQPVATPQYLLR